MAKLCAELPFSAHEPLVNLPIVTQTQQHSGIGVRVALDSKLTARDPLRGQLILELRSTHQKADMFFFSMAETKHIDWSGGTI